jgi:hypothetical protein
LGGVEEITYNLGCLATNDAYTLEPVAKLDTIAFGFQSVSKNQEAESDINILIDLRNQYDRQEFRSENVNECSILFRVIEQPKMIPSINQVRSQDMKLCSFEEDYP